MRETLKESPILLIFSVQVPDKREDSANSERWMNRRGKGRRELSLVQNAYVVEDDSPSIDDD